MDFLHWFSEAMDDVNILSSTVRLTLAVIFGGIIGLERGANKHQAGLRTHILVCLGAALAMLTNQYIIQTFPGPADPARLGAQVISGIGFLGAGLILVTSKNKVKGLTTAAGLWASACIGLAIGIGFYSGAVVAAVLVFVVLAQLTRLEDYFYNRSRVMNLMMEFDSLDSMRSLLSVLRLHGVGIKDTNISQSASIVPEGYSLMISIRIPKKRTHQEIIEQLSAEEGVILIEELE